MDAGGVEVEGLRKVFGEKTALEEVSFTVEPGAVVGLLGPNGAGKTTVVNCLSTLLPLDGGRASVAGHDVARDPAGVRASLALTGQFAAVDDVLTGRQNLVLFGRLLKLDRRAAAARAGELLTAFGLDAAADQRVASYSGGMRRRLDLAASLVVKRPVVVLDEPTTGLDPAGRREMWDVVTGLREEGVTLLLTTQYLEEADRLADRIVLVDDGRVVAEGTPAELKKRVGGQVCEVVAEPREQVLRTLRERLEGVEESGGTVTVRGAAPDTLADVVAALREAGIEADDIRLRRPTLDEVFFALTGRRSGRRREQERKEAGS
ncbi:ATP-binding cassette domain-containing protein [Planomonospora parontospora]|uniref:ATP-binding cassette domain-containing protein n=1 Tax=Planomonospora parontospora TaxID=58119 RepID=UPI001671307E|nr:ATP-binding cassette domain-containing protein [Planomonospora parontospora]GGL51467.1 daunorubicin resistance protein DrrA family ABC transporter ATP-binding protein [Planomonospora parontospora subsp. antibiotica]GII19112.1 daunorubicin resistance protein DrrA family ABC transporter ATP-binding protein [Planomonospora parontospora subsp. antibiotica]